ncbi:MAG: HEAT repeat domain-containing protein [Myxococcota bacterium]|jgi:hypothetical protein|nr:HEAT repeat domain-containing protein [Myxococcota bacterium]
MGASPLPQPEHDALKEQLDFMFRLAQRRHLPAVEGFERPECELGFELIPVGERVHGSIWVKLRLEDQRASGAEAGAEARPRPALVMHTALDFMLDAAQDFDADTCLAASTLLMKELAAQLRVAALSDDELELALRSSSSAELLWALSELRRRMLTRAAWRVRDLLLHNNRAVVLAAIASLGQLRDETSVTALSGLLISADFEKLSQTLYALGAIRSRDALDLLRSVAATHPSELIRLLARDTLHRAQRSR